MTYQGSTQGGVVLTGGHGTGQTLDTVRTQVGDVEETVGTGSWTGQTGLNITDNHSMVYLVSQSPPLWTDWLTSGRGPGRCWMIPSKVFLARVR